MATTSLKAKALTFSRIKSNKIQKSEFFIAKFFFSIGVCFQGHWRVTGQQGKGGDHSDIYLQLCMWDEYHIFFTRLYLPGCYSMRFTTLSNYHFIDWWWNFGFRFFTCWFDSRFLLQLFEHWNRWTRTRIVYHLCISSEPTNQMF